MKATLTRLSLSVMVIWMTFIFLRPGPIAAQGGRATPDPAKIPGCNGIITTTISTHAVDMCNPVDVELNVQPWCTVCPGGINIIVVEDSTPFYDWQGDESIKVLNSMMGKWSRYDMHIGVVHYNSQMVRKELRVTDKLSSGKPALMGAPRQYDPEGDFIGAAKAALELLAEARKAQGAAQDDEPCEVIIFFAYVKDYDTTNGQALLKAAKMLRQDGIPLLVGCPFNIGEDCGWPKKASRLYTEYDERNKLLRMFDDELGKQLKDDVGIKSMTLSAMLPEGLSYVDGSANLPPTGQNQFGTSNKLTWAWDKDVIELTEPLTVTFRAEPAMPGSWEMTSNLELALTRGVPKQLPGASQGITITDRICNPSPTPVPTEPDTPTPPPTPTDTPVPPTATTVPTEVPTATPTATPKPRPIFLPILIGESCTEQWVYSDVVLVLDLSTSMNRLTRNGRTKLAATQDAAKAFLERMDFSPNSAGQHDQVAVVGFNRIGWIQQELTSDKAAIMLAIDDLAKGQAEFTRLDLAFLRGLEALRLDRRKAGNTPVIVMLTDGLPNQVPYAEDGTMETTVLRAAATAKTAGAKVYTIAIGAPEDTNPALLKDCATTQADFRYTPDPEDLAEIYTEIAYSFGCPASRFWGKR